MTQAAFAQSPSARNVSSAFLEIGRVLADRDGVTFRAKGTCMYPTVRAGDVLRVQSRPAVDIRVGDIAVFRRLNYLFGHRVIDKGSANGRAYIVTRPDGRRDGSESPIFDEDLLGVVVAIERAGKQVPIQPRAYLWPARCYFACRLALLDAVSFRLFRWAKALAILQETAPYRKMARLWFSVARPRITYLVRLPMPAMGDAVCRQLPPETFDVRQDWRERPVQRWTLTLHLDGAHQPAASATMVRGTDDVWSVTELFVHPRYRGAGLDEALMRQIDDILRRTGGAQQARAGREEPVNGLYSTVLSRG